MQTRARDHIDSISEEKTHAKMLILQGTLWNGSQGTVIDRESPGVCVCERVLDVGIVCAESIRTNGKNVFFFISVHNIGTSAS